MEDIRMSREKYSIFLKEYIDLHDQIMTKIEFYENELKDLLCAEKGFYAEETTQKVFEKIALWDEEKRTYLKHGFRQMEECIQGYIDGMQRVDKLEE